LQPRRINILEGSTFVVSDLRGDIGLRDDEMSGLFYRDMRHLSRWQIRLNGRELDVLSGDTLDYDEAVFFLVEPTGTIYRNPSRWRRTGGGMYIPGSTRPGCRCGTRPGGRGGRTRSC